MKNHLIKLSYVNHCFAFPLALSIKLLDNKDKETKWGVLRCKLKMAKAIHLVKYLVNKLASFVFQKVHSRLDGEYLCLSVRLKRHFHPTLKWYPNEAFKFLNGEILGNELSQ